MTWSISNYSTTPASNTAINGINIAPGCPSSSASPFFRQIMADIAAALAGGQLVPPGAIFDFPVVTPPAGYLACDGSNVSRATFAALFALIGTNYGNGDGSTTFTLPNYRGRVRAGYDAGGLAGLLTANTAQGVSASTIGNFGGEQSHTLVTGEMPSHTHAAGTLADSGHGHAAGTLTVSNVIQGGGSGGPGSSGATSANNPPVTGSTATGNAIITGSTASTGTGSTHNNVQPTAIVLTCIKT